MPTLVPDPLYLKSEERLVLRFFYSLCSFSTLPSPSRLYLLRFETQSQPSKLGPFFSFWIPVSSRKTVRTGQRRICQPGARRRITKSLAHVIRPFRARVSSGASGAIRAFSLRRLRQRPC